MTEKTVKIRLYYDDFYPYYYSDKCDGSESKIQSKIYDLELHDIPKEKYDWIKRIEDELWEAQRYLESISERKYLRCTCKVPWGKK